MSGLMDKAKEAMGKSSGGSSSGGGSSGGQPSGMEQQADKYANQGPSTPSLSRNVSYLSINTETCLADEYCCQASTRPPTPRAWGTSTMGRLTRLL